MKRTLNKIGDEDHPSAKRLRGDESELVAALRKQLDEKEAQLDKKDEQLDEKDKQIATYAKALAKAESQLSFHYRRAMEEAMKATK